MYSLYFYTYRPPEQMRKQFFSISFKEIDSCWILPLTNEASNYDKIMSSLDNEVTNKQSMPCSIHKLPNEHIFNSSLWCILWFSIKITWRTYRISNSIATNKSENRTGTWCYFSSHYFIKYYTYHNWLSTKVNLVVKDFHTDTSYNSCHRKPHWLRCNLHVPPFTFLIGTSIFSFFQSHIYNTNHKFITMIHHTRNICKKHPNLLVAIAMSLWLWQTLCEINNRHTYAYQC